MKFPDWLRIFSPAELAPTPQFLKQRKEEWCKLCDGSKEKRQNCHWLMPKEELERQTELANEIIDEILEEERVLGERLQELLKKDKFVSEELTVGVMAMVDLKKGRVSSAFAHLKVDADKFRENKELYQLVKDYECDRG